MAVLICLIRMPILGASLAERNSSERRGAHGVSSIRASLNPRAHVKMFNDRQSDSAANPRSRRALSRSPTASPPKAEVDSCFPIPRRSSSPNLSPWPARPRSCSWRCAERVDRLGVVADDCQAVAAGLESQQDRGLQAVGVLILVNEDMIEATADVIGQGGVAAPSAPSRAGDRRNRERSASAWLRRRPRTAPSAPPPIRRTMDTRCR
jgi:hypothetical protein